MSETENREFQQTLIVDGERLEIVATEIGEEEWLLAVRNSLGIYSVWLESFTTPDSAIDAAMNAIEAEGVEAFVSVEGFEYLLDDW